ncbi:MAG: Fpg/Nei family DNA glycosylase [Microbacteriaceae bacterium]
MPEGHSVHRIARQFERNFVGSAVTMSSPQGRFAAGASQLDGLTMTQARAVGKHMFLEFDHRLWLRVHLGIYGAWDFAGDITVDATTVEAGGRMGQTNQRGTVTSGELEESLASIGAPRLLRMSEGDRLGERLQSFPPEPVGAVRVRVLTTTVVADLRGPTACEVLHPEQVQTVIAKLGPDPLVDGVGSVASAEAEARFVSTVAKKPTPIGVLLMDQSVVSGIGNVYRAELLFRARLNPHTPGKLVPVDLVRALWKDWAYLLEIGVRTGQMMTIDGLTGDDYAAALSTRENRHWVYHREGKPCRVCGTPISMELAASRKLYWCSSCQA